ncbi:MAG: tetratricopeptide repeat protein, partial [Gemmatimonadota bacterium]
MPPDSDVQKEIEQLEQRFAENAQGLVFAHLADAYRRAGEFAKAEGLLLHGLKTHSTYTSAYNVLGRVYLESERFADAHEQFSKVLELDPQNLIALQALGDLAARGGRLEDARSWYERMLQIDPRSKEAQEGMISLEAAGQESAAAEVAGEAAVESAEQPLAPQAADEPAAGTEELAAEHPGEEPTEEAEEVPQPWDFGELLAGETEESVAELMGEPVEGLLSDNGMAAVEDAAAPEMAPWEEPAEEESPPAGLAETTGGEPDTGDGDEAAGMPPAEQVEGVSTDGPKPGAEAFDLADLDLGIMDDWTPGLLGGEEPAGAETFETDSILEGLGEEEAEKLGKPEEGVVTETMAELYAAQGLYEDAIGVYRQLAEGRPDDERIQARIGELEARLAGAPSEVDAGEEELAELLELTQPVADEPGDLEPAAEASPPLSVARSELAESGHGAFEFDDEAPVAGFEQLDPFAASFDIMAMKEEPAQPLAVDEQAEPAEAMPADEPVVPTVEELAEAIVVDEAEQLAASALEEPVPGAAEEAEAPVAALEDEEELVEAVSEESTWELAVTSPDDEAPPAADVWELTVEVAGDDVDSELGAEEFGAEIAVGESAVEPSAEDAPADFAVSE